MQLSDALIKSLLRQGQIVILVPESYYEDSVIEDSFDMPKKPKRGFSIAATPSPSSG